MNVPVAVPVPKSKKGKKIVAIIIGCIAVLISSAIIFFTADELKQDRKPIDSKTVNYNYMDSLEYYELKDVCVFDCYGTVTYDDSSLDEWYYLIAFDDKDGYTYFASLKVEGEDSDFQRFKEYSENDDALIGDMVTDMCVENADKVTTVLDSDVCSWYQETVEQFNDMGITDSGVSFEYACPVGDFDNYIKDVRSSLTVGLCVGIAIFALGAILVIYGFCSKSKATVQNVNSGTAYQMPEKPVYYDPLASKQNNDFAGETSVSQSNVYTETEPKGDENNN